MPALQPLIITLSIDPHAQDFFTGMRNRYFPKWCNYLEAHVTLFHQLPAHETLIKESVEKFSRRKAFSIAVTAIKQLENGVAYELQSEGLAAFTKR